MKRIIKLLPDKYYLDKNFMPLAEKIATTIEFNEKNFTDGLDQKLTYDEIKDLVTDVLLAIKPKYSLKTGKCY